MKNVFYSIIVMTTLLLCSCTPGNPTSGFIAINDPDIFIKLNYKGMSITTYGIKSSYNDTVLNNVLKLYSTATVNVGNDGSGNVKYSITLDVMKSDYPNVTQQFDLIANGERISNNPLGTYNVEASMFKDYTLLIPTTFEMGNGGSLSQINITSIDQRYISGTFIFDKNIDVDGVSVFPATGSFRLNRMY